MRYSNFKVRELCFFSLLQNSKKTSKIRDQNIPFFSEKCYNSGLQHDTCLYYVANKRSVCRLSNGFQINTPAMYPITPAMHPNIPAMYPITPAIYPITPKYANALTPLPLCFPILPLCTSILPLCTPICWTLYWTLCLFWNRTIADGSAWGRLK